MIRRTLKYEEERAALRKEFRFDGKGPIIVAGSTHSGEEDRTPHLW